MGLFDQLDNTPEIKPEEEAILKPQGESLEAPDVQPETVEETLLLKRTIRESVEEEEAGGRIGNPVEFAEQFNNTIIAAAGAPVDLITWALNKASNTVAGKDLIDPETAIGGSKSIKSVLNPLDIGSERTPDSYMGYAGQTFGEATAFLAGGAAVVKKTKDASGVIGALSKQADDALKTKLGSVVAAEGVVSAGMAGGRQISVENEFGTTGALATEFATGALAMVAGGGSIALAKKLKNMTQKEALEKLSKEEIAEVVAEGQRVIAKEEPSPKKTPEPEEAPEASATTATPKDTPEPTPAPKTPEVDAQYEKLVEENPEAAKKMLLEEAKKNGYDVEAFHGTHSNSIDEFASGTHFGSEGAAKARNADMAKNIEATRDETLNGFNKLEPSTKKYFDVQNDPEVKELSKKYTNKYEELDTGDGFGSESGKPMPKELLNIQKDIDNLILKKLKKGLKKQEDAVLKAKKEALEASKTKKEKDAVSKAFDQLIESDSELPKQLIEQYEANINAIERGSRVLPVVIKSGNTKRTVDVEGVDGMGNAMESTSKNITDDFEDGVDTLQYKNEFEGGESYVISRSDQVRSADLIVKDKDGNVIPLSQRFAPAPKTPEATPKADPIDEAIESIDSILTGDRTGGKGARVTRKAKRLFRTVTREFFGDITDLIKTKDVASAKKILARIDKYIEFDRKISQKDYAQGSELQANSRNAMENGTSEYTAGISAAGNKRTQDLQVLKGMLQKLVDGEDVIDDVARTADEAAPSNKNVDPNIDPEVTPVTPKNPKDPNIDPEVTPVTPKPSTEEMIDTIADQVAKTFLEKRAGVFQTVIDGYFNVRLVQMLNQAKTAFVGVPSATMMAVVRPMINTPYNIAKSLKLKDASAVKRLQYASADIAGTYEYVRMMTKHLKDTLRSSKDTILNRGDSNFLYRDRNAYIKDQLAEATEAPYRVKKKIAQAERRAAARNAETKAGRVILNAKATVMNSKLLQVPAFFFDYGVSLIGGLEEISLIAHSMRAARAAGIKKGIDDGVDDVWKFSEDYMEGALDRSRGTLQAKYEPEYADIFNQARRDHFRAMDLDPNDIRKDMIDGVVAGLAKVSGNHDEMGYIARTLFVFIGVPMRALGTSMSYIGSPVNVAKNVLGGAARKAETAMGGTATFGKYNKKISELEIDIKNQKSLLDSDDADVTKAATKKMAELEDELANVKDLKMQKDYEDLGKLGIGAGLFFLGYEMAKNGQVAGTDSWMTEEQKLAAQKVQGAPNSWKVVMGGSEYDFRYFDPLKGVFALGADYARRQAAQEAGSLTDDQTMTQFVTSVSKSLATDSPFATGARYVTQIMSPNPSTQDRGVMGVFRSMLPVPAEMRNFNKFDEEFVTDTSAGEFWDTSLAASMGKETGNYRLTTLGEPKLKEEPSLASYILPFAGKKVPEREPIDDILLEDAMSFRSVSDVPTSISGLKLKQYVNEDNEDAYSLYGRFISEKRLGGKNLRQALNALVRTTSFKEAYKEGYVMNEQGSEVNEGIEMIKEIIGDYRENARDLILNSKAASDYEDGEGNNIYDILKEREEYSERPEGLLESLNIQ